MSRTPGRTRTDVPVIKSHPPLPLGSTGARKLELGDEGSNLGYNVQSVACYLLHHPRKTGI